jgi:methyltransferase (TIGR00027 family)
MVQAADSPVSSHAAPQPSISAMNVARCRAIAAFDPREAIYGADTEAEIFLDDEARQSLRNPAVHGAILQKLAAASPGGYEFFAVRTAYLDSAVEQALRDDIPQIVLLGAGYDTRAYRFRDLAQHTRIFELDTPATQTHKRSLLDQAQIATPAHVTFVPIDFTRQSMAEVLAAAGYASDRQTLFIWEGVTYYLPPDTVDDTLQFVRQHAPAGSAICFDYMLPASDLAGRFGAEQSRAAMEAMYTAEPLQFDLAEGEVGAFLAARSFEIVERLTADDMQRRYLTLADGSLVGQVLGLFGLVRAVLAG